MAYNLLTNQSMTKLDKKFQKLFNYIPSLFNSLRRKYKKYATYDISKEINQSLFSKNSGATTIELCHDYPKLIMYMFVDENDLFKPSVFILVNANSTNYLIYSSENKNLLCNELYEAIGYHNFLDLYNCLNDRAMKSILRKRIEDAIYNYFEKPMIIAMNPSERIKHLLKEMK